MPLCVGGGAQFSSTASHLILKQTVNATLGALLQISYFTTNLQYTIFYNIIWDWGRQQNARIYSRNTTTPFAMSELPQA
jgi:hypothetical protein